MDDIDDILRQKRESREQARQSASQRRAKMTWKRQLVRAAVLLGLGYVAIIGFLLASETSLVYPGSKYPKGNWEPGNFSYQEIQFHSKDGTTLFGWYLPRPQSVSSETDSPNAPKPDRTFLLCHGNAENIAESGGYSGNDFRNKFDADLFVFDYRGFGKCEGTPTEPGVLEDSEAALNWLCSKTNKQPTNITLIGHSLGGGPAVHLANKFGCKMLILQRTYSAVCDAGQNQYPWLPVRLLMRNQYLSREKIKTVKDPLFQSHGDADTLIPIELGRIVFDNSPASKKQFFAVEGMAHWDPLPANYWTELERFIIDCESQD